jgi:hypothetical protein
MDSRFWRVLILPAVAYGLACSSGPALVVGGEELAWKVENEFFAVDFSSNPETGRSGQINTIELKQVQALLTRGTDTSTLHLSPNLAQGQDWVGVNRWDPVPDWSLHREDDLFRLSRSGPMPVVPELRGSCVYEIRHGSPAILVEEVLEATDDAEVSLLRLDEWSIVPDQRNPFTHLGWAGPELEPHLQERQGNPRLPLKTAWVAFYNPQRGFGLASVLDHLSLSGSADGGPALVDESLRFGGQAHYFYRAFIYPPNDIGEGDADPLVKVARGSRYEIRYYLLFFRGEGTRAETALQSVVDFHAALQQQR